LRIRPSPDRIEHVFDTMPEGASGVRVDEPVDPQLEDAADWASIERELRTGVEDRTWGNTAPSGLFALEIDADTSVEAGLSDEQLIDAVIGFERLTGWAQARQTRLLAEFARRRPGDDPTLVASDKACTLSKFAPDEVGLALKQARMTAKARLGRSFQLEQVLPETLALWERGRLDERRVTAICDTTHYLPVEKARAVQQRVLDRAPDQTLGQPKAALKRAVIAADPEGAADRHKAARRDRRVSISEEQDGMASLWALMAAPDAQASYQWLTRLALGCGKDDPRGMDARRADLAAALLSGRLTNAAPEPAPADTTVDTTADTDNPADDGRDDSGNDATADTGDDTGDDIADPASTARTTDTASQSTGTDDTGSGDTGSSSGGSSSGGSSSGGSAPRPVNPGKPLVQVLMPFSTLIGADDQPCELVGHGPIPADLAREVATDAVWKRLVHDPLSGTVLDHGRTTYRPPTGLADHVRARDVCCRSPICRRRALDGHLDHITPYPDGPTNDKNLHACCGHDHRMKHAPGWAVRALPDGRIQWITPTGHRYHSHAHDYRPDEIPPDLPPDKPPAPKALPRNLAARLERIERDRRTTALWNGETIPPDGDDEGPPPF
jgi:uncharacterized membrane protein YgcG